MSGMNFEGIGDCGCCGDICGTVCETLGDQCSCCGDIADKISGCISCDSCGDMCGSIVKAGEGCLGSIC